MDKITLIRELMYLSMDILGNTHETTVKLSQRLDILIVAEQKKRVAETTRFQSKKF